MIIFYFNLFGLQGSYTENGSLRNRLYSEWADLNKWIRLQPTDDIKNYLGVKFAFYFAWLGFYTQLLIPATFFGLIVVIYGIISSPSQDQSRYVKIRIIFYIFGLKYINV